MTATKELLKEGTLVTSELNGGFEGKIVGVATNELPVFGNMYIIRVLSRRGLTWKNYPYSCVALPESQFFVMRNVEHQAEYEGEIRFQTGGEVYGTSWTKVTRYLTHNTLRFSFEDTGYTYTVDLSNKDGLWVGTYTWSHPKKGRGSGAITPTVSESKGKLHIQGKWVEDLQDYTFSLVATHLQDKFIGVDDNE